VRAYGYRQLTPEVEELPAAAWRIKRVYYKRFAR
jgi:hypothetical protein